MKAVIPERFVFLDGLRGVAAIAVVMRHLPFFSRDWLPASHLAVDLFFVLSGFVIAHAYDERLRAGMGWKAFMVARIVRLYPLFFLAALVGFATRFAEAILTGEPTSIVTMNGLSSLFLIPSMFTAILYPTLGVAWSLLLELVANFVFGVAWNRLTLIRLSIVAFASAVMLGACIYALGSTDLGFDWRTLVGGLARVGFGFPVGVLLYRAFVHGLRSPLRAPIPILLLLLLVFVVRDPLWQYAVIISVVPLIVWMGASVVLGSRAIASFLGAASYPLYLFHIPVGMSVAFLVDPLALSNVARLAVGFVVLAVLLAGSWLAGRYYDQPVRRALGVFLIRRAPT